MEYDKRIEELETLLTQCEQHNKEIVKQNQNLQAELRFLKDNSQKDDSYIKELEVQNIFLKTTLKRIAAKSHYNPADKYAEQMLRELQNK